MVKNEEGLGTKVRVRRSMVLELEVGCNVVGEWGTPAAVATTESGEETIAGSVRATAVGDYFKPKIFGWLWVAYW